MYWFSRIIFAAILSVFLGISHASAFELNIDGGTASPIIVKEGQNLSIEKQALSAIVHFGYTQVKDVYQIKNNEGQQFAVIGFAQKLDRLNSNKNLLSGVKIKIDGQRHSFYQLESSKDNSYYIEYLTKIVFGSNETKEVQFEYLLTNGIYQTSTRNFQYLLSETQAKNVEVTVNLSNSISKNDLITEKIFPQNPEFSNNSLHWAFTEGPLNNLYIEFKNNLSDIEAINLENSNLQVHNIISNGNNLQKIVDSSYFTAQDVKLNTPIHIDLKEKKSVNALTVIPGKIYSSTEYVANNRPREIKLKFDDNSTRTVTIADEPTANTVYFPETSTRHIFLSITSNWNGQSAQAKTIIGDMEFSYNKQIEPQNIEISKQNKKQQFWHGIKGFFVKIFS